MLRTDNHTEATAIDRIHFSIKSPSTSAIIFTEESSLAKFRRRTPYDLEVIIKGKTHAATYLAREDERWKTFRVAWLTLRPYVFERTDGSVGGIDWKVWNLIGEKLGIKFKFLKQSPAFVPMYMKLPHRQAELALLGTSFNHQMLQVPYFLFKIPTTCQ